MKVIRLKVEGGFVFALLRMPPSPLPPFTFIPCCAARKKRLKPWTPWRLPPFTFAPRCMLTPVTVQASGDVHLPPFTFAPCCAARKKRPQPWTPWRLPPFTFAPRCMLTPVAVQASGDVHLPPSPLHLATFAPAILPQSRKTQRDAQLHLHVCNVPFSNIFEDVLRL